MFTFRWKDEIELAVFHGKRCFRIRKILRPKLSVQRITREILLVFPVRIKGYGLIDQTEGATKIKSSLLRVFLVDGAILVVLAKILNGVNAGLG